jgi:hypothetical protein
MKKLGLSLLAVVMVVGLAGCNGGDDFTPSVSNMAGVYSFTKVTYTEGSTTVTFVPPDISGTLNLTSVGTYYADFTIKGEHTTGSGSFVVSGDTIIVDGGDGSGPITDDGRKFTLTFPDGGSTMTLEFARS